MIGKYGNIEFWAENGICYIKAIDISKIPGIEKLSKLEHSDNPNKLTGLTDEEIKIRNRIFKGLPPREFIKRAIAVGVIESARFDGYPRDLAKVHKFLLEAKQVYEEAIKQGAIDDPKADEWKEKHRPFKQPRIVVPGMSERPSWINKNPEEILLGDESL